MKKGPYSAKAGFEKRDRLQECDAPKRSFFKKGRNAKNIVETCGAELQKWIIFIMHT